MKSKGIILVLITLLISLTGCIKQKEQDSISCIEDNACVLFYAKKSTNPDDPIINFVNSIVLEELNILVRTQETLVDYDAVSTSSRLIIQLMEGRDVNSNFDIERFNSFFEKIQSFLEGQGITLDDLKVEIKTLDSFNRRSIFYSDGKKSYRSLFSDMSPYNEMTETEMEILRKDTNDLSLFDRASNDFLFETISVLFDYKGTEEGIITVKIVHRDYEDTSIILYDEIFNAYANIIDDHWSLQLVKEE